MELSLEDKVNAEVMIHDDLGEWCVILRINDNTGEIYAESVLTAKELLKNALYIEMRLRFAFGKIFWMPFPYDITREQIFDFIDNVPNQQKLEWYRKGKH